MACRLDQLRSCQIVARCPACKDERSIGVDVLAARYGGGGGVAGGHHQAPVPVQVMQATADAVAIHCYDKCRRTMVVLLVGPGAYG